MSTPSPLPIVAIVGRPNVGKSTLFNRWAGQRRALVADTPGVTRDRVTAQVEVGGRRVLLVDTAGLDPDAEGRIDAAVQAQVQVALEQADAVVLVVDGQAGLLPEEKEIARRLRRTRRPLAVAVNKIDSRAHEVRVAEFHALGLEPLRGVSAEHGSGAWDLLEELVARLPGDAGGSTEPRSREGPEAESALAVALVGRPNTGKSSLLNRLVGYERVVVSDQPGTTRDSVDVRIERDEGAYVFVDTAGLRRPGRRDRLVERASAFLALRALERARVALVMVDADEGLTDQDVRVLAMVRERGRACALVLNKWDLVQARGRDAVARVEHEAERRLTGFADVPILRLSAWTGRGMGRIFPVLRRLGAASGRRVPTAELNRWLAECVALHQPAMAQRGVRRRPVRLLYATQTGTHPPSFVVFCSQPTAVQPSYLRFLEKRLRERFSLEGVPIRLRLRPRRSDPGERGADHPEAEDRPGAG
jgi:GTP-binding protein